MIEIEVVVKEKFGMHLRPITEFVQQVSKFKSSIKIIKNDEIADGKSPLDILTLILQEGDIVKVIIDGEDENEVVNVIKKFFSIQDNKNDKERTDT